MERLCIIPCGKKKIWDVNPQAGPTPARAAYLSTFHRNCQAYARAFFGDHWVILSARHGFLRPDDLVPENYDAGFSPLGVGEISIDRLREQAEGLSAYRQFVVLGGRKFDPILRATLGDRYHTPLRGCQGIGSMNQALIKAVREHRELA